VTTSESHAHQFREEDVRSLCRAPHFCSANTPYNALYPRHFHDRSVLNCFQSLSVARVARGPLLSLLGLWPRLAPHARCGGNHQTTHRHPAPSQGGEQSFPTKPPKAKFEETSFYGRKLSWSRRIFVWLGSRSFSRHVAR
jgi:hypothetical protein